MFLICSGGKPTSHATVDELAKTLSEHHRGDHVAIQFKRKDSGIDAVHHVSVGDQGGVFDAYGTEEAYDFNLLKKIASVS